MSTRVDIHHSGNMTPYVSMKKLQKIEFIPNPPEAEWCLMVGKWKKLFTFFLFACFCSPLTLKESNYRNEITKKWTLTSSGISQKEKEKHCMISIICRQKNDTNELIYKTEADLQTQRMDLWLPEEKHGGRDSYEVWYQHVHTAMFKSITNKALLYSARNSA